MKRNTHTAVGIIAVLSLLLGLSLGQLQHKHRSLEKAHENRSDISVIRIAPSHCNIKHRQYHLERIQAEVARERAHMKREKARRQRELEKVSAQTERDKTQFILLEEL